MTLKTCQISPKVSVSVSRPLDVSVSEWFRSHLGRIDERLGLGIESLCLGISLGLGQLGLTHALSVPHKHPSRLLLAVGTFSAHFKLNDKRLSAISALVK